MRKSFKLPAESAIYLETPVGVVQIWRVDNRTLEADLPPGFHWRRWKPQVKEVMTFKLKVQEQQQ